MILAIRHRMAVHIGHVEVGPRRVRCEEPFYVETWQLIHQTRLQIRLMYHTGHDPGLRPAACVAGHPGTEATV